MSPRSNWSHRSARSRWPATEQPGSRLSLNCNGRTVMGDWSPHPVYRETVLEPNFRDARKCFLESLLAIHRAHTSMLAKQSIITAEEERVLLEAIDGLDRERIVYDASCEDLFFAVEKLLEESAGVVAGKMHTARSRND